VHWGAVTWCQSAATSSTVTYTCNMESVVQMLVIQWFRWSDDLSDPTYLCVQDDLHGVSRDVSMCWEVFQSAYPASWVAQSKLGEIPDWRSRVWSAHHTTHLCQYVMSLDTWVDTCGDLAQINMQWGCYVIMYYCSQCSTMHVYQ